MTSTGKLAICWFFFVHVKFHHHSCWWQGTCAPLIILKLGSTRKSATILRWPGLVGSASLNGPRRWRTLGKVSKRPSRVSTPPATPAPATQAPPIAPFTPGHSVKLLNALSADPQSNQDLLGPVMFPAGTVGEVRKSRTFEVKANLAASVRRIFRFLRRNLNLLMNHSTDPDVPGRA
jgi:hypothetical protein